MPKYLKGGVPVLAVLVDGSDSHAEMIETFGKAFGKISSYDGTRKVVTITTPNGPIEAPRDSWVVRDPGNKMVVVSMADFNSRYTPA